jgi:hypothetical protein
VTASYGTITKRLESIISKGKAKLLEFTESS